VAAWVEKRVPHPDAPGLEVLVDDPAAFVAGSLHRAPVLGAGREVGLVAESDRLWDDVLTRGARAPAFRLVRAGTTLPPSSSCRSAGVGHRTIDDVIQPNRVLELYDDGATVVLQGLQFSDPHLARVANNLALAVDQPVQVNAYLSPPSARGLDLHVDLHDVFVLQLEGSKRWRVWEPLERTRQPVKGGPPMAPPTFAELGAPDLDVTLHRGDVLYLPRGHPHCAETVDDSSAHLTVGVLAITWQRALRGALDAAVADGKWRSEIRLHGADVLAAPEDVAGSLRPFLGADAVRRWMVAEVWRRQPATRLRPRRPPGIDRSAPLTITPGPLVWCERDGDACVIGLGDRRLVVPAMAHHFVTGLLTAPGPVAAADLGCLDDDSQQVVVDRLALEGVVAAG